MFESDIGIVLFMIKTKNSGVHIFYLNNFSTLDVKAVFNCTFCNHED